MPFMSEGGIKPGDRREHTVQSSGEGAGRRGSRVDRVRINSARQNLDGVTLNT